MRVSQRARRASKPAPPIPKPKRRPAARVRRLNAVELDVLACIRRGAGTPAAVFAGSVTYSVGAMVHAIRTLRRRGLLAGDGDTLVLPG